MSEQIAGESPGAQPRVKYKPFVDPQVYAAELREIRASRALRGTDAEAIDNWLANNDPDGQTVAGALPMGETFGAMNLTGLALSGGGIRSAAVCLGVLQAFALQGKLRLFDYMSTVSGGGFIGSSWSALQTSGRKVASPPDFPYVFQADTPSGGVRAAPQPAAAPATEEAVNPDQPRDEAGRTTKRTPGALDRLRGFINPGLLHRRSRRSPAGEATPEQYAAAAVKEDPVEAEQPRRESGREPCALDRLRDFANYLIPRGLVDQVRVPALLLRGILVNLVILLPWIVGSAVATVLYYGSPLASQDWPEHPFQLTQIAGLVAMVGLLIATAVQSYLRRRGTSSWRWRNFALSLGATGFLLLLAVAWLDLQAVAVPLLVRLSSGDFPLVPGKEALSAISGLLGILSAIMAGRAATIASPLVRRLAFTLLAILGPIALWFLYANACIWIAQGEPTRTPVIAGAVLAAVWSIFFVDINATSLHSFYRDKLSNAFIMRLVRGDPVHADEVQLSDIAPSRTGGPYHLINTTANTPHLGEKAQRGRRSESFLMSPLYCGNDGSLGYCRTRDLEAVDSHISLATAMAISGAAAAPNAGQQTLGPIFTFTLAMLNVRLGYWCRIPESIGPYAASPPPFTWRRLVPSVLDRFLRDVGPLYFLMELLGLPHLLRVRYVNLTDGGHLDNLGILELLRRRCRYIVAIDAEADPMMVFTGLAVVQRIAWIDLGVRIDIDVGEIKRGPSGNSRWHWALGTIEYGDGEIGELLYIKSSVTGTEVEYVSEYRARHPEFPHETTGDQFFNETQFEAYRALGEKMGTSLLQSRYAQAHQEAPGVARRLQHLAPEADTSAALFARLRDWLRPAAPFGEAFLQLQRQRRNVEAKLRRPEFAAYAAELYPEIRFGDPPENGAQPDAEALHLPLLQIINEQMQLMERVVLALHLDDQVNQMQPRNRGWLNLFRRWSQAPTFRRYWTTSISDYSDTLQSFCRHVLGLRVDFIWDRADENSLTPLETATLAQVLQGPLTGRQGKIHCLQAHVRPDFGPEGGIPTADAETPQPLSRPLAWRRRVVAALAQDASFPVAIAAIEDAADGPVLRCFRVRDTYRNMRLGELLLERLKPELIGEEGVPARYELGALQNEAVERLERLLYRLGFVRLGSYQPQGRRSVHSR